MCFVLFGIGAGLFSVETMKEWEFGCFAKTSLDLYRSFIKTTSPHSKVMFLKLFVRCHSCSFAFLWCTLLSVKFVHTWSFGRAGMMAELGFLSLIFSIKSSACSMQKKWAIGVFCFLKQIFLRFVLLFLLYHCHCRYLVKLCVGESKFSNKVVEFCAGKLGPVDWHDDVWNAMYHEDAFQLYN